MSTMSDMLRPVGMLEKLYTARQVLGIYNSVVLTATYAVPPELEAYSLYSVLCAAIPGLLRRHPPLCCFVEDQRTPEPKFKRLKAVHVKDVLQVLVLEMGRSLSQELQELHDQEWLEGSKPLWKLVVMREPLIPHETDLYSQLHIAFVYHHVLGDGMSGCALHESLLQEIESIGQTSGDWLEVPTAIDVPTSPSLIEPIEKLTALPLSWPFLAKQIAKEYASRWLVAAPGPIWAGLPVKSLDICPYRSRVQLVTIPADGLVTLLEESKKHSVTLTCLLTAAIVSKLAQALPEAPSFLGITPYTLRRVTGTSMDDMVVQISSFETRYSADLLSRIRKASGPTEQLTNLWNIAVYFRDQMQDELVRCPRDNPVGLLPYLSNYTEFYSKKFGRAREATFELSNLGVFERPKESSSGSWRLENMIFTQGAAPVGPAFVVNVASVQGGPLTIAITWQDTVVNDMLVDALGQAFAELPYLLQEGPSNQQSQREA